MVFPAIGQVIFLNGQVAELIDAKLTDREIKGMVYSHIGSNPVLTTKIVVLKAIEIIASS